MDLDDALDRLYAVPLAEFTATRNALAAELGPPDGPKVKTRKKPNLAAWALNQLPRQHADELEELFGCTQRLRSAQRRVLSGGKATPLREATDERNTLVSKLTGLAGAILMGAGHAASGPTLAAISDSLVAIASDDEGADRLRLGRLERELEPSSVLDVGGLTLVEGGGSDEAEDHGPAPDEIQRLRDAVTQARVRVTDLREEAKRAETEASRLHAAAEEAERRAKAAREEAEFARRAAEARRAESDEAEAALAAAQKELGDAER